MKKYVLTICLFVTVFNGYSQSIANFKYKVIKSAENQDQRPGNDSEVKVYLMIQNQLVDTYSDFGAPELESSKTQLYLNSKMSEKNYEIIPISSTKIQVKRHLFCSDCETQEHEMVKTYLKDGSGKWKYQSCKGDCN
jgi:hypothetical protein